MCRFYLAVMFVVVGCGLVWVCSQFSRFSHARPADCGREAEPERGRRLCRRARGWGLVEWSEFSDLAWSLVHSGHGDVVAKAAVYHTAQNIEVEASR